MLLPYVVVSLSLQRRNTGILPHSTSLRVRMTTFSVGMTTFLWDDDISVEMTMVR